MYSKRAALSLLLAFSGILSASNAGFNAGSGALNLVTNGSFEQSGYAANYEFDTNSSWSSQKVTGWTGTGYTIYFLANTQTTVSASNQWSSSTEKLGTAVGTGGKSATTLSPDGGNFVALDGDPTINSTIYQNVALTPGQEYTITFNWAAGQLQSRTGATNESVNVQIGSGSILDLNSNTSTVNIAAQAFAGWYTQSYVFVAKNAAPTLTFFAKSTSTCLPPMVLLDGVTLIQTPEPGTFGLLGMGAFVIWVMRCRRS